VSLPDTMRAMVTTGPWGFRKALLPHRLATARSRPGEVLIKVGACGLNNTDINTREGWYSKAVTGATGSTADTGEAPGGEDPSWGGAPIAFPRIQGADVCGRIVAVGHGVDPARIGERVITDNWLRDPDDLTRQDEDRLFRIGARWRLRGIRDDAGPECAGGGQPAVGCGARDLLLLLFHRRGHADPRPRDRADTVLIPGASGGVGGALVQLAKLRGARVDRAGIRGQARRCRRARRRPSSCHARPRTCAARCGRGITVLADVVGGPAWPGSSTCWNAAGATPVRAPSPGRW
jgi:hypothetical protein